jgi:hypothetical protein
MLQVYVGPLSELEACESMMGTLQGASSPMVYEIPFTTPALGALFCRDTVLVEDISADGCQELLSVRAVVAMRMV